MNHDLLLCVVYVIGAVITATGTLYFLRSLKTDCLKVTAVMVFTVLWPVLWALVFVSAMWEGPL
jgi:hypothetical protein